MSVCRGFTPSEGDPCGCPKSPRCQGRARVGTTGVDPPQQALGEADVEVPAEVATVSQLSPWAVQFRYGVSIDEELDRAATVALVASVLSWCAGLVEAN